MQRSILVFPVFADDGPIENLRRKHDPLYGLVPPHLTLVFPFECDSTNQELLAHMRHALGDSAPFALELQGLVPSGEECLFLAVRHGQAQLVALHDRLYTGPLRPFLRSDLPYQPHLTVGCFHSPRLRAEALRDIDPFPHPFTTVVDRVCLESIEENGRSRIEGTVRLEGAAENGCS